MLNEIVPAIMVLVITWGIGIWGYSEFSDKFSGKISKAFLLISIATTVYIALGILGQVCKYIKPPTTIEESGYTYQLEDYEPEEVEETIEKYGKTYVLVTE